jgi:HEAT repeat protein
MKSLTLLLALDIVLVCVAGQGQDYKGRSLTEWKARTQPSFSVRDRQESIRAVAQIGWNRTIRDRSTPEDMRWVTREITPTLIELLDDASMEVRLEAVLALGGPFACVSPSKTPPEALAKLMERLADQNAEIRRVAAGDIVSIRPIPEKEALQLLRHKDIVVRRAAAKGLLSVEQFRAELVKVMNEDFEFCRKNVQEISRVGPGSVPILVRILDDKNPNVRSSAALSLARLGPAAKEAVPTLKHLLTDMTEVYNNDDGHRVCHSAGQALNGILGDRDYLKGLPTKPPDGL